VAEFFPWFRVEWKVNEVADSEATTFAIFYNNALFLFLFLLLAYLCRGFHPAVYPCVCVRACVCVCVCMCVYVCAHAVHALCVHLCMCAWHWHVCGVCY